MAVVNEAGEAHAWLKLPPPDTSSYIAAAFEQHVGRFYYALKSQRAGLRQFIEERQPATGW